MRSWRCTTGVDTGGKWEKSSIINVLIILFGHLWEVELSYRYIFAFKFTLRSQQPDIVPIICHRCYWYQWCTLTCEYLCEFSKKLKTVLMGYSGAGGKLIHEKNQKQKISWHCPFNLGGDKTECCHYTEACSSKGWSCMRSHLPPEISSIFQLIRRHMFNDDISVYSPPRLVPS